MKYWRIRPGTDPEAAGSFADLDAVFALQGEIISRDALKQVLRKIVGFFEGRE